MLHTLFFLLAGAGESPPTSPQRLVLPIVNGGPLLTR
jgi:hypothetical protein